ncbi:hypothetical protein RJ639_043595, partial [Escallonia herrerae]
PREGLMETGGTPAIAVKKTSLTPKAIIYQRFGSKACYKVEEVHNPDPIGFPGLAKGPCRYRCSLQLPEISVLSDTFERKKDAEQSAAEKAIEKVLGILTPTDIPVNISFCSWPKYLLDTISETYFCPNDPQGALYAVQESEAPSTNFLIEFAWDGYWKKWQQIAEKEKLLRETVLHWENKPKLKLAVVGRGSDWTMGNNFRMEEQWVEKTKLNQCDDCEKQEEEGSHKERKSNDDLAGEEEGYVKRLVQRESCLYCS